MSKLLDEIYRELNNIANDDDFPTFTQKDACRYYNTICQHRNELNEIAQECENHDFYLHYNCAEENQYYMGDGELLVQFEDWYNQPEYSYKIVLHNVSRDLGYCMCKPTDEGYNAQHKCCGAGCDASFPAFDLVKSKTLHFEFNGVERDLWALEAEWNGTTKEDYEEKARLQSIKYIEEEISKLNETRNKLLNEGNNNA